MEYSDRDAFDVVCGSCDGVNIMEVTEQDVRDCAAIHAEGGEPCSEEMILAAIRGLREYQDA